MTDVETLQAKIAELEQQKQAHELLKTIQEKQTPQMLSNSSATRQLMVVPNEHNLRKFSGRCRKNKLSVEDFIDNCKSAITLRGLPSPEQANFILLYMEEPAKETKLFAKSDLQEPEEVFDLLSESFGERHLVPQLLKAFYDCSQREGETLCSFSCVLRGLQSGDSEALRGVTVNTLNSVKTILWMSGIRYSTKR